MIYMILVSPNCIELYVFKESYDHPCILSILLEFSCFQKRIFMGFQRVKLWVEFSIWIWYSKIIIELFKRCYRIYEFYEILRVFKQNLSLWDLLSLRVLRCDAYFHMRVMRPLSREKLCGLWVVRWAIPIRRMSWVKIYE